MARISSLLCAGTALAIVAFSGSAAFARPLTMASNDPQSIFREVMVEPDAGVESNAETPAQFRRQVVSYATNEAPGTIVIDTPNTYLYYVLGNGRAIRYGIGVGREGFTWAGTQNITKKAEWPDWTPPAEMIARQPYLPRFMAGGRTNPLGARAMYLGSTAYRIHGTNAPETIGHRVSSGCIRLTNEDVSDLYSRVNVGTKVVVMPMTHHNVASAPQRPASQPTYTANSYAPATSYAPSPYAPRSYQPVAYPAPRTTSASSIY